MLRHVIAGAAFAAVVPLSAYAAEILAPAMLKAGWFDGRTISTTGPKGGKSDFSFKPDGTVVRTGGRAGSPNEGTWRLDEEGFCMKLGEAKRESCYLAVKADDGSLRVMRRYGGSFLWTR